MEIKSQGPGGPEWRGDVCHLDQQPVGSPLSPQCSPGLPPVPGQGNSLTSLLLWILFHCFNPFKFTLLLIS